MDLKEYLNSPAGRANIRKFLESKNAATQPSPITSNVVSVEPGKMLATPVVMTCHYKNPQMTDMCLKSLLKTNSWVKKIYIIDTSEDQSAPEIPNSKIVPAKGCNHSQGVQKGLDWIWSKYFKGKINSWVLLIDSDVIFDHDVSSLLADAQNRGCVLAGHMQHEKVCKKANPPCPILPRIHPAFCMMRLDWLKERKIPFMDWDRLQPEQLGCLGHRPQDWKVNGKLTKVYDVGATMLEDVTKNGGTVVDFGDLWEWENNQWGNEAPKTVYHIGSISWGDEKWLNGKYKWVTEKFGSVISEGFKFVNVLTRFHHGREERFKELVKSLEGQSVMFHVSIEEENQRQFVLSVVPDARVVKVEKGTGPGFFNGYINKLKKGIDGIVWVLDSDDVAFPGAVDTIIKNYNNDKLNVFPVKWRNDRTLPRRNPDLISSQCLVWNPSVIKIDWSDEVYEADNHFYQDCKKTDPDLISFVTLDPEQYVAWLKENNNGK